MAFNCKACRVDQRGDEICNITSSIVCPSLAGASDSTVSVASEPGFPIEHSVCPTIVFTRCAFRCKLAFAFMLQRHPVVTSVGRSNVFTSSCGADNVVWPVFIWPRPIFIIHLSMRLCVQRNLCSMSEVIVHVPQAYKTHGVTQQTNNAMRSLIAMYLLHSAPLNLKKTAQPMDIRLVNSVV